MIARLSILASALMAATVASAEDRALLIGIDDYSAVTGAPVLAGAVNDVGRMADLLTGSMGFDQAQILRLENVSAHHEAILSNVIDRLVGETSAGDRVFVYFAGLGTTLPDGSPALVAHNGDTVLGRIPVATFESIFDLIADREVTVIFDTGFQAGPFGSRGFGSDAPTAPPQFGDALTFWAASAEGQYAWEDIDGGVFTRIWASAITTGAADLDGDGTITNGELFDHATSAAADWCIGAPPCADANVGLNPIFSGDPSMPVATIAAPAPVIAPTLDPIEEDDGLPASYRETLGFVTDLFAPSNDAGLSLAINGGDDLQIGEIVSFTATANRPGALLLLDLDPSGALAQVYPSRLTNDGGTRLTAGEELTIPSAVGTNGRPLRIRVTGPEGPGLLLGLFIEGDLPQLTTLMPAGLDGGPIPNGGQSLFEISQNLLRMEADPEHSVSWSATYLPYRIEP